MTTAVIELRVNNFDVEQTHDGEGYYYEARYGDNILDPATGYYVLHDSDDNDHYFILYPNESPIETLTRFRKKFPDWDIELREVLKDGVRYAVIPAGSQLEDAGIKLMDAF